MNGLYDARAEMENNGVFYGEFRVEIKHITDGLSKTFAFGERDGRCHSGTWIGARNPPGPDMWGSYYLRGRVSIRLNDARSPSPNTCTEGFSSAHAGGGYFAMCDGSVTRIQDDIDFGNGGLAGSAITNAQQSPKFDPTQLGVYQRLGIRNDQQPVGIYE